MDEFIEIAGLSVLAVLMVYVAWILLRKRTTQNKQDLMVHLTVDASILDNDATFLEIDNVNNASRTIVKAFTEQLLEQSEWADGDYCSLDFSDLDAVTEFPDDADIKARIMQTLELDAKIARHADDAALLAKIVASEPVLGTGVLRVANAAYYRDSKEIKSLKYAIEKIGVDSLRVLVVTSLMGSTGNDATFDVDTYTSVARHSAYCAICASYFGSLFPELDKSVLYTAGLLHDLGKIIALGAMVHERPQCLRPYMSRRNSVNDTQLWQCDHAHLGAAYLSKWKFDPLLVTLVKAHHYPSICAAIGDTTDATIRKYLFTLYLANQFAKCISPESEHYVAHLSDGFRPMLRIGTINNLVEKTNIFNDLFKVDSLLGG